MRISEFIVLRRPALADFAGQCHPAAVCEGLAPLDAVVDPARDSHNHQHGHDGDG